MAKRPTIIATFANGDIITRVTARPYSHAWRAVNSKGELIGQGFAFSRLNAARSNAAALTAYTYSDGRCEIAEVAIAGDGYMERLKRDRPFTILVTYMSGLEHEEKGTGGRVLRFDSLTGAQSYVRQVAPGVGITERTILKDGVPV